MLQVTQPSKQTGRPPGIDRQYVRWICSMVRPSTLSATAKPIWKRLV